MASLTFHTLISKKPLKKRINMSQPNVTIGCSIMLERDGKLLLIKEARPNVRGKWNTPAGTLRV